MSLVLSRSVRSSGSRGRIGFRAGFCGESPRGAARAPRRCSSGRSPALRRTSTARRTRPAARRRTGGSWGVVRGRRVQAACGCSRAAAPAPARARQDPDLRREVSDHAGPSAHLDDRDGLGSECHRATRTQNARPLRPRGDHDTRRRSPLPKRHDRGHDLRRLLRSVSNRALHHHPDRIHRLRRPRTQPHRGQLARQPSARSFSRVGISSRR